MKKLLWFLVLLVTAFFVAGMFLPAQVHVERSVVVERPPSVLYPLLNGFRHFNAWSPWAAKDPDASYEFSGPDTGVGSRMDWDGDPASVGSGSQQITAVTPNERIDIRLDFGSQGVADSAYLLEPIEGGTRVTWSFDADLTQGQGPLDAIIGRWMGLFYDRWVGADYEQGLANFKRYAESFPAMDFDDLDVAVVDAEAVPILYVSGGTTQDPDDIADALATAYGEISRYVGEHGIEPGGQPMAITRAWDEEGYRFDAAVPVPEGEYPEDAQVRYGESPSGRAVRVVHHGPYDRMMPTYEKLAAWMSVHGLREGEVSWEHYVTDPAETPPDDLRTHIYFLVRD